MIYIKKGNKTLTINPQIFVLLAIWVFTFCYYLQVKDLSREARLFPEMLFIGTFLCGIFIIKDSFEMINTSEVSDKCSSLNLPSKKVMLFIVGIFISMHLFLNTIALVAIIPSVILLMYITGIRNIKTMILVGCGLSLFIYLFFGKWLTVNLPNFLA